MKIRTVCGDIEPEALGFTLIHEHVVQDISIAIGGVSPAPNHVKKEQLKLTMKNLPFLRSGGWMMSEEAMDVKGEDYLDFIVNELKEYKAAGGSSLCECSVYGLMGRSYEDLRKISEASGIHIIHGVGTYADHTRPAEFVGKSEDEMKQIFETIIDEGFGNSGVFPGFVKATLFDLKEDGCFYEGELDVFKACAKISAERDMPMQVHITAPPISVEQIVKLAELAKRLGASPQRINFCHMDGLIAPPEPLTEYIRRHDTKFNIDAYRRILDTGINISFDGFGNPLCETSDVSGMYRADEYTKVSALYELVREGYAEQIMLGHDFTCRICATANGGYGYTRVPDFVCSMLGELGCKEAAVKMTVTNPMKFLAY